MSDYNQVIKTYDKQIMREIRKAHSIDNCVSFWRKKLFIEACNLNVSDWRQIRDKQYWDIKNKLRDMGAREIELHKFTYSAIINYKKQKI